MTLFSRRKGGNGKLIDQSITKITRAYSFRLEAATVTIVLSMIMHGDILACVFGGLLVHFRALRGKGARAKHVVAIVVVLVTSRSADFIFIKWPKKHHLCRLGQPW